MPKVFKDIYFFFIVLYSGMSLSVFRSNEGLIVVWLIGLVVFNQETYYTQRKLLVALGVWMGYFVINTILIGSFHPMFMGTYIAKIMIAYWLLSYYKENIFLKYENTVYILTVISIFFYIIELIAPVQLYNLLKSIDLSNNLFPHKLYASIGIFTYHRFSFDEVFPRNAGFTWEPGPFSSYVVLALFVNLARHGNKIKDPVRLVLYLLAIISSQSTTSFVVLLAVLVWFAWSKYKNRFLKVFSFILALGVVSYLFINLPWLQNKIINESEQDLDQIISYSNRTGESVAPGRFVSLQMRWEDFKNYPIAGFGGNSSLQTGYFGEDHVVAAISGIGAIMGRYGAIGTLVFLVLIFSTGKWLAKFYKYKDHIIFPVLILMIGFGFGIIESPIIVTLWMVPVFLSQRVMYSPNN